MDKVNKNIKDMKIDETKIEIVRLRIKNKYYRKHTVIDKVIEEILFEQFDNTPTKEKKRFPNRN
jgi:hypothetical protein